MPEAGRIEWAPRSQGPCDVRTLRRTWSNMSAELSYLTNCEMEYRVQSSAAYIALHDVVRSDGQTRIDGLSESGLKDLRGKLTFVPSGVLVEGWSKIKHRDTSVMAVHIYDNSEDDADVNRLPASLYFGNESLRATLIKIASVLKGTTSDDLTYADTLGVLLRLELRRAASAKPILLQPIKGGLTPYQLKRIDDYLEANLSGPISIPDLSKLAGLSDTHFIRAFKKATGISPYQHVLAQRVQRAQKMLLVRGASVADVATSVGFSSSTQLNRAFRNFVGRSPLGFRRDQGYE